MRDVPLMILEIILIANMVVLISITSKVWRLRKKPGSITFGIMVMFTVSISFFYLLEVASNDFDQKLF
jgi:hypothetical protein